MLPKGRKPPVIRRCVPMLTMLLCGTGPVAAVEVEQGTVPDTGLRSWKFADHGFSLELMQLQGDFVRAIYGARGFSEALLSELDDYCVYGSIAKNLSDAPLSYRVADWRYTTAAGDRPPKTKSEWVAEWRQAGIPYNWSILPDDQTFDVGDWGQGFTTIKAARSSQFDLTVSWTVKGETHEATIHDMHCPPQRLDPD